MRRPPGRSSGPLDRGGYGAEGPVLYRSEPIAAPHRFDLVGIAGAMHAYEFRAREDGGEWSRWAETDNGDPVYTGGSDEVQIRSRNRPIRGTLHYVNVKGDTTFAGSIVNGLRGVVNSAVITTAGIGLSDATAATREPDFITRREWGAKQDKGGCEPRVRPEMGRIKAGVIHHTVNTNKYSEAEAPGIVLGICRFHRNGNGWNDIGYNALVDRFGNVYQGRAGGMSRPVIGAHAEGVNTQTTGVAAIGDFTRKKPSRKLRRGLIQYLAWKLDLAGVPAHGSTFLKSTGRPEPEDPEGPAGQGQDDLQPRHDQLHRLRGRGTEPPRPEDPPGRGPQDRLRPVRTGGRGSGTPRPGLRRAWEDGPTAADAATRHRTDRPTPGWAKHTCHPVP